MLVILLTISYDEQRDKPGSSCVIVLAQNFRSKPQKIRNSSESPLIQVIGLSMPAEKVSGLWGFKDEEFTTWTPDESRRVMVMSWTLNNLTLNAAIIYHT